MKFKNNRCRAFAPATVSNVGPGFDICGFAIHGMGDEVEAKSVPTPGVSITSILGMKNGLPLDAWKNTAGKAVLAMVEDLKMEQGIELTLFKNMPSGSGLGSSAASAAAAVTAVNGLLEIPLEKKLLIPYAMAGEAVASGGAMHGDNIVPCIMGGFTIIKDIEKNLFFSIKLEYDLYCVVVHPDIIIETAYARSILPKEIQVKKAIRQAANASLLIAGLLLKDDKMLCNAIEDEIAEPYRKSLIPAYDEARDAAFESGALGFNISGSGPSVFALFTDVKKARNCASSIESVFNLKGIKTDKIVSLINCEGSKILEVT